MEVELSDPNGNPILTIINKDGQKVFCTYDQALAKYYHADVYGLAFPKEFDKDYAVSLKPKAQKAYSVTTVPRENIIEFLKVNVNSLSSGSLQQVTKFIGSRKHPGTIHFNLILITKI